MDFPSFSRLLRVDRLRWTLGLVLALADPAPEALLEVLSMEIGASDRRDSEPLYHLEEFQEALGLPPKQIKTNL